MDTKELSYRILTRRKQMGLSQTGLADAAGISRNYVSLLERGEARNMSMKVISQLALALGTTPAQLLGKPDESGGLIPPALRQFGLQAGLSYSTVDRLSAIPARGQEPQTVEGWQELYKAIRPYLEEGD